MIQNLYPTNYNVSKSEQIILEQHYNDTKYVKCYDILKEYQKCIHSKKDIKLCLSILNLFYKCSNKI